MKESGWMWVLALFLAASGAAASYQRCTSKARCIEAGGVWHDLEGESRCEVRDAD